jgi:dethiobiotin synthetase
MTAPRSPLPAHGFFVTGTDTGVGKTLVSAALLHALAAQGLRVVGMKPVAAGCDEDGANDDVRVLAGASNVSVARELANPYCFAPAIAPHIAAERVGVAADYGVIERAYAALRRVADAVVVEGAGGFLVPLGPQTDFGDLARRLGLPVILVVGMRLGCLNHALLTAEAVQARGLPLAGWVANHIDPAMAEQDANVAALAARLGAPLLARIPPLAAPDPLRIAAQLDLSLIAAQLPRRSSGKR